MSANTMAKFLALFIKKDTSHCRPAQDQITIIQKSNKALRIFLEKMLNMTNTEAVSFGTIFVLENITWGE